MYNSIIMNELLLIYITSVNTRHNNNADVYDYNNNRK